MIQDYLILINNIIIVSLILKINSLIFNIKLLGIPWFICEIIFKLLKCIISIFIHIICPQLKFILNYLPYSNYIINIIKNIYYILSLPYNCYIKIEEIIKNIVNFIIKWNNRIYKIYKNSYDYFNEFIWMNKLLFRSLFIITRGIIYTIHLIY